MSEIKPIALREGWKYYYDSQTDRFCFEHSASDTLIEIEAKAGAGVMETMKDMLAVRRIFRHARRKGVSDEAILARLEMKAIAENTDAELRQLFSNLS